MNRKQFRLRFTVGKELQWLFDKQLQPSTGQGVEIVEEVFVQAVRVVALGVNDLRKIQYCPSCKGCAIVNHGLVGQLKNAGALFFCIKNSAVKPQNRRILTSSVAFP